MSDRGVSLTSLGVTMGLGAIGVLFIGPMTPQLTQRCGGAPKLLIVGLVIYCLARFGLAALSVASNEMLVPYITIIYIAQFSTSAVCEACCMSMVMACCSEADRTKANGILQASRAIGSMFGPPLGGLLYDHLGYVAPIMITAAPVCLMLLLLLFSVSIGSMPPYALDEAQSSGKDGKKGGGLSSCEVLRLPGVGLAAACFFIATFNLFYSIGFLQPFLSAEPKNIPPSAVGIILSLGMIGLMVGGGLSTVLEKKIGPIKTLGLGFLSLTIAFLFLGPSPLPPFSFLPDAAAWPQVTGCLLMQAGFGCSATVVPPLLMAFATAAGLNDEQASQQSAMIFVMMPGSSLFISPALGGLLADALGPKWAFTTCSMATTVASVLVMVPMSRLEANRARDKSDLAPVPADDEEEEGILE